jgi:prepilin peptidase CpaA
MVPVQIALWTLLAAALLISAFTDIRQQRILDVVTYPVIVIALTLRWVEWGWGSLEEGLLSGLVAAGLAAAPLAVFALRRTMGWGDVKLMAAVGAVLGYPLVWAVLLYVSLCGGVLTVVLLLWKGNRTYAVPYGVAIALGAGWAVWWQHSAGTAGG